MTRWVVRDLVTARALRVEDGNHGNDRPRPDEFVEHGVAFIRAADMTSGVVDFASAGKINDVARRRIRKGVGAPSDVILSHKGTVGRVAVAPIHSPEFVCSPQTTFWRSLDSDIIDQTYLSYVLRSADFQRQLATLAGQTDMAPYVSLTDQRSMTIDLPAISDQRAIAGVLGALDGKIAANETAIQIYQKLSSAIFWRAAAGGLGICIRDVAAMMSRGIAPSYTDSDGLTVLNQKCIRDQWVDLRQARTTEAKRPHQDRILQRNDVLVNSTGYGTLGRAARWTHNTTKATVDSHITIVRFDPSLVDPACAGLAALELESQIESLAEGSTGQTELRRDLLGALELRLPDLPTQHVLGQRIEQFDDSILSLRAESIRLARTRNELLPLLMSGKVHVRDAERVVEGAV
jgi:type I restriction enzyme, S subunit